MHTDVLRRGRVSIAGAMLALAMAGLTVACGDQDGSLIVLETGRGTFETADEATQTFELTLQDFRGNVTYFTEAPDRAWGTLEMAEFLELWNDAFPAGGPNAAIVAYQGGRRTGTVIVELTEPEYLPQAQTLRFHARMLPDEHVEATDLDFDVVQTLPASFDAVTLFIDAFPSAVNSQVTD
jgi:hypothetical protein